MRVNHGGKEFRHFQKHGIVAVLVVVVVVVVVIPWDGSIGGRNGETTATRAFGLRQGPRVQGDNLKRPRQTKLACQTTNIPPQESSFVCTFHHSKRGRSSCCVSLDGSLLTPKAKPREETSTERSEKIRVFLSATEIESSHSAHESSRSFLSFELNEH